QADAPLAPEDANAKLLFSLERFAPFGMKNEKPAFAMNGVTLASVSWFGKAGEHLRIAIARGHEAFPEPPLEAIAFYARRDLGRSIDSLSPGAVVSLLAHLEKDQFSRGTPVRLRLIGIS
ncbi:MAG TPA: hypothetical protein VHO23_03555, partial [Candidatus Paceibacterota bacterium]|nr:hypothetical protein [Candidatus Paceibacterota bacterium]